MKPRRERSPGRATGRDVGLPVGGLDDRGHAVRCQPRLAQADEQRREDDGGDDDGNLERDGIRGQRGAQWPSAEERQDDELHDHDGSQGDERGGDERATSLRDPQREPAEETAGDDDAGGDAQRQEALRQRSEGRDQQLEDIERQIAAEAVRDGLDEAWPVADESAEDQDQERRTGGGEAGKEHAASGAMRHGGKPRTIA